MVKVANETIQAFPVTQRTYVGAANGYTKGGVILHAAEDGDITFDFGNQGTVVLSVTAGQDIALASNIKSITSTGVVWIS
jgi:hypothetical protein